MGAFVKLTTFSAKDSPIVLQEAACLLQQPGKCAVFRKRSRLGQLRMLSEAMTDVLSVSWSDQLGPGDRALRLLATSPRVKEDLEDAAPNLCLREWHTPLPIWTEFRGFVYDNRLNAVGQYVHNMCFPELQDGDVRRRIKTDIQEAWQSLG